MVHFGREKCERTVSDCCGSLIWALFDLLSSLNVEDKNLYSNMLESGVIPVGEGNVLMAKHTEKSFLIWLSIYDAAPNASCQSRKEKKHSLSTSCAS